MAFSAKHLCVLLCILLSSSPLIQARESKFFSKFNNYQKTDPASSSTTIPNNNNNNSELNQEQVPAVKQEEEQTSNGYGLYGHDSNQSPSTTTENSQEYTYTNAPSKISTEEYTGGSYENKEVNTNDNYYNNNKQYGTSDTRFTNNPNINNNNGYNTKQYGTSDTRFMNNPNVNNNGYNTKQYDTSDASFLGNNNNGYRTQQFDQSGARLTDSGNVNSNNAYETKQYGTRFAENENNNKYYGDEGLSKSKQQGLSDTRFLENGKYYYNVNNENSYLNNYQPVNGRYDGFNPSQVVTSRNNYNYGNDQKEYEFNQGESQYQGDDSKDVFSP